MSKRVKITFASINEGKFTIIPKKDIAETNKRIKTEMKVIIRNLTKKQNGK
jgi:hypothetical protein